MDEESADWCDECHVVHSWWAVSREREPGDACQFLEDHLLPEDEPAPVGSTHALARKRGRSWPTLVRELTRARAGADVTVLVGLAVRAGRRRLGQSQRGFAGQLGLGRGVVERLETNPSTVPFGTVVSVLREAGFELGVVTGDGSRLLAPGDFASSEFIARDWGGRRFPAHAEVSRADGPRKASVNDPCLDRVPWWQWSRPG
ncbi:MAG: hypothetical protein ABI131_09865 [Nostocoides sp.]